MKSQLSAKAESHSGSGLCGFLTIARRPGD